MDFKALLAKPVNMATVFVVLLAAVLAALGGGAAASDGWKSFLSVWLPLLLILAAAVVQLASYAAARARGKKLTAGIMDQMEQDAQGAAPSKRRAKEEIRAKFEKGLEALRKTSWYRRYGDAYFSMRPWWLVAGPSAAGKSTLINNSGLDFPGSQQDQGEGGTRDFHWWFTDAGIILDTAGNLTQPKQDPSADVWTQKWYSLLDLVKRLRPGLPINGLLLVVAVDELRSMTTEQVRATAKNYRAHMEHLREKFGVDIPNYVIVNKCDKLPGFLPFFRRFANYAERMTEVVGWTNHGGIEPDPVPVVREGLVSVTRNLCDLRPEVLATIDPEIDPAGFAAAYNFPDELALVGDKLVEMSKELFRERRGNYDAHFCRGIYFTCGRQAPSETIGSLLDDLAQGMKATATGAPDAGDDREEACFAKRLFTELLRADEGMAAPTPDRRAAMARRGRLAVAGAVTAAVGLFLPLFGAYSSDLKTVAHVKDVLDASPNAAVASQVSRNAKKGAPPSAGGLAANAPVEVAPLAETTVANLTGLRNRSFWFDFTGKHDDLVDALGKALRIRFANDAQRLLGAAGDVAVRSLAEGGPASVSVVRYAAQVADAAHRTKPDAPYDSERLEQTLIPTGADAGTFDAATANAYIAAVKKAGPFFASDGGFPAVPGVRNHALTFLARIREALVSTAELRLDATNTRYAQAMALIAKGGGCEIGALRAALTAAIADGPKGPDTASPRADDGAMSRRADAIDLWAKSFDDYFVRPGAEYQLQLAVGRPGDMRDHAVFLRGKVPAALWLKEIGAELRRGVGATQGAASAPSSAEAELGVGDLVVDYRRLVSLLTAHAKCTEALSVVSAERPVAEILGDPYFNASDAPRVVDPLPKGFEKAAPLIGVGEGRPHVGLHASLSAAQNAIGLVEKELETALDAAGGVGTECAEQARESLAALKKRRAALDARAAGEADRVVASWLGVEASRALGASALSLTEVHEAFSPSGVMAQRLAAFDAGGPLADYGRFPNAALLLADARKEQSAVTAFAESAADLCRQWNAEDRQKGALKVDLLVRLGSKDPPKLADGRGAWLSGGRAYGNWFKSAMDDWLDKSRGEIDSKLKDFASKAAGKGKANEVTSLAAEAQKGDLGWLAFAKDFEAKFGAGQFGPRFKLSTSGQAFFAALDALSGFKPSPAADAEWLVSEFKVENEGSAMPSPGLFLELVCTFEGQTTALSYDFTGAWKGEDSASSGSKAVLKAWRSNNRTSGAAPPLVLFESGKRELEVNVAEGRQSSSVTLVQDGVPYPFRVRYSAQLVKQAAVGETEEGRAAQLRTAVENLRRDGAFAEKSAQ